MRVKRKLGLLPVLCATDVRPIVTNVTRRVYSNLRALKDTQLDRGWCVLTYKLLQDPFVLATKDQHLLDSAVSNADASDESPPPLPVDLVPDEVPSTKEELVKLLEKVHAAAFDAGRTSVEQPTILSTALAISGPLQEEAITINVSLKRTSGDMIRQCLQKIDLDAARQRTKELREEGQERFGAAEQVRKMTSGQYWRNGGCSLADPDLLKYVQLHAMQQQARIDKSKSNKKEKDRKMVEKVQKVLSKEKKKWTQDDYRSLVRLCRPPVDEKGNKHVAVSHIKMPAIKQEWEKYQHLFLFR